MENNSVAQPPPQTQIPVNPAIPAQPVKKTSALTIVIGVVLILFVGVGGLFAINTFFSAKKVVKIQPGPSVTSTQTISATPVVNLNGEIPTLSEAYVNQLVADLKSTDPATVASVLGVDDLSTLDASSPAYLAKMDVVLETKTLTKDKANPGMATVNGKVTVDGKQKTTLVTLGVVSGKWIFVKYVIPAP